MKLRPGLSCAATTIIVNPRAWKPTNTDDSQKTSASKDTRTTSTTVAGRSSHTLRRLAGEVNMAVSTSA